MTRRLKRSRNFDVTLEIKNDGFIRPPREAQRNWLLKRAMAEFAADLVALDRLAAEFVPGTDAMQVGDREQADLSDAEIMEDWQIPIMQAMADVAAKSRGQVLEIGYGRGVAARMIQAHEVASHTIIECNRPIMRQCEQWRATRPERDIRPVLGRWQDVLAGLGCFDSIFFHTYPLNEEELLDQIGDEITFAAHFFSHAARHLVDGGIFTYLSNEIDSLGRGHQRSLMQHFSSISMRRIAPLALPVDVRDAWWSDSMMLVSAVK
jgi:guanidinoacetate N-methyltransferase